MVGSRKLEVIKVLFGRCICIAGRISMFSRQRRLGDVVSLEVRPYAGIESIVLKEIVKRKTTTEFARSVKEQ